MQVWIQAHHWTITITSVQRSAATVANNERNDALEPYVLIGHVNGDGTVFPLARTDLVSATKPPARVDIYSSSRVPRLYLIDRDPIPGGSAPGEMLDFVGLPPNDPGGVLTLRHGPPDPPDARIFELLTAYLRISATGTEHS